MFIKVFVVYLMCPADSLEISVIRISKYFETLVNENVMNQKISDTV